MTTNQPLVSIGMPVYNGGQYLRGTLDSLLEQTYRHCEIIISDNASTDTTAAICQEFAARDNRVRYHRNQTNIGPYRNFRKVLALATGEYFMWAAHDDRWEPEFVEANLRELVGHDDVIASMSKARFLDGDSPSTYVPTGSNGTYPLTGSVAENVAAFLLVPGAVARYYGLFRRDVLLRCAEDHDYWGAELALVVRTLAYGKYQEVDRFLFSKQLRGVSYDLAQAVRKLNGTRLSRAFPLWEMTWNVLKQPHVPKTPRVLFFLLLRNLSTTIQYWMYTMAGARATTFVNRALLTCFAAARGALAPR